MDLFVLHGYAKNQAIALARRGPDIALSRLDLSHPEIRTFIRFTEQVELVALGGARPTTQELDDIGNRLFAHIFQGEVGRLYDRLPTGRISIQIATDEPDIQRIPWEFIRPVDRQPVPHRERCVVRILPMCATSDPAPAKRLRKLKVLLVVADPVDQPGVTWQDVEHNLRRVFEAQTKEFVTLKVIPGATSQALISALNTESFDVFHFLGHGCVVDGVGRLVLVDVATRESDFLAAEQVAVALAGERIKLAILSACLSGAGKDDFGPVAHALLRVGIPAVVANQTSIPTKSVAPFVAALYQKLLHDGNIDSAMMSARVALKDELRKIVPQQSAVVEWGIPSLYRLPNGAQLFSYKGNGK
ncbi:CHAT domain-containing protein [Luteibacter jiangsuensis]